MPYQLFDTAFGTCAIAWSELGLTRVQLPEATPAETESRVRDGGTLTAASTLPVFAEQALTALESYFQGVSVSLENLLLDESLVSEFNARAYRELRSVPRGKMITYGDLAQRIGQPSAAQAMGLAMSKNPWPVIVPCHRVVGANGKLIGFSAHGGVDTKLRLLTLEGTQFGASPGLFDDAPDI